MSGASGYDKDAIRARFEHLGPNQVRHQLKSWTTPTEMNSIAIEWLAEKDQEEARLSAASQADMAAAASRAATAAERAASAAEAQARTAKHALITAIVATVIAAIALAVSIATALHFAF